MELALSLADIPLDLQITICTFLHPTDILALRKFLNLRHGNVQFGWLFFIKYASKTPKVFLPSFPIPEMSDLELERAAIAPRRWIELCGKLKKQHSNDHSEMRHPRTTRYIMDMVTQLFIVPGGRYLVTTGDNLCVWDLGYDSTVNCKLVASVEREGEFAFCTVQATLDGKGLVILSSYSPDHLSIFEIYPQSETPLLTQIAHLDWISSEEDPTHLLPDILIHVSHQDGFIVFRVVDYRTNYSTRFLADVEVDRSDGVKTAATKTAIIVLCEEGIYVWAIPPLSTPQSSDLPNNNPTHIPPLFKIPYPDGSVRHTHEILKWITVSSWYIGSRGSVYFDILFSDSILQRFKITIKPDLSDASLHFIDMSEVISKNVLFSVGLYKCYDGYRICEDALVYGWNSSSFGETWGTYAGLMSRSAPFTNVVTQWKTMDQGHIRAHSFCPASGRFVYCSEFDIHAHYGSFIDGFIVVADL